MKLASLYFYGTVFFLCLVLFIPISAQKAMIYRNDNSFHSIPLSLQKEFKYTVDGNGEIQLIFPSEDIPAIPIENVDSIVMRTIDIPTVSLELPDYPNAHQLWDKENYINAKIKVEGCGYCDDFEETELNIKGRGNSSWALPKKPIRLKFNKKISLCGMKKAKSYVLLANYLDQTHMHNTVSMYVARELNVPYSNHDIPVNLIINGEYQGLYQLTEKIGINSASVDIDENQGVLLEISLEYDEPYKFRSVRYDLPMMIKDPDLDQLFEENTDADTPEEMLAKWERDFNQAEEAVYAGNAFEYIDLDSFVNYMIVNNFAKNDELGWPKSLYLSKESLGGNSKYKFGPVWDHDISYNMIKPLGDDITEVSPTTSLWKHSFLSKLASYPEFKTKYAERFEYLQEYVIPQLFKYLDEYASLIEPSAKLDGLRWDETLNTSWIIRIPTFDHRHEVESLKTWISERFLYLQNKLKTGAIF